MYKFELSKEQVEMVLYALSKMDRDLNSDYDEFKDLYLKMVEVEQNK